MVVGELVDGTEYCVFVVIVVVMVLVVEGRGRVKKGE